MSSQLISRSGDLARLVEEGYALSARGGALVVRDIPYLDSNRCVRRGTIIAALELAGEITAAPSTHWVGFIGGVPYGVDGRPLRGVGTTSGGAKRIAPDGAGGWLQADTTLCMQPAGREFADYHEMITTYVAVLEGHARKLDSGATARTHRTVEVGKADSPFSYTDTASARADISDLNARLAIDSVAIVGLGGTGSYVLDLVAKTPVRSIHLYDDDLFLQHNAFRAPGAASLDDLGARRAKVDHLAGIYSSMHKGIIPHRLKVDEGNVGMLDKMDFVFICVDDPSARELVSSRLAPRVSYVEVGMGLHAGDGGLFGLVRVSSSTHGEGARRDATHHHASGARDIADPYRTNVQVADMNMLNAALAVISWKRLAGFYADEGGERECVYVLGRNTLLNA